MRSEAEKDCVAWLKAGDVRAFNEWRQADPYARVDLSGANLRDVDLRRANLRDANLKNADLDGADLSEANLTGANLKHASIKRANLVGVSYAYATMSRAQRDTIEQQNRSTIHLID